MKSQSLSDLSSIARRVKGPHIKDIVLFGSFAKGKLQPNDIDICLIVDGEVETAKLEKQFGPDAHLVTLVLSSFPKATLWKTLLNEGVSLLTGKKFSEILGYTSGVIYLYDLKGFTQSDKVRFFYALKGRGENSGVLKRVNGKSLGRGVLSVPTESDSEMQQFFLDWEIPFNRRPVLFA